MESLLGDGVESLRDDIHRYGSCIFQEIPYVSESPFTFVDIYNLCLLQLKILIDGER